jgi:hypothetical protein
MYSKRFQKPLWLTAHARVRMKERDIPKDTVLDIIETGTLKRKDERHLWVFKSYPGRQDNLLCAAVVEGKALIVKTLMNHWHEEIYEDGLLS